jgi:hypothetical protein
MLEYSLGDVNTASELEVEIAVHDRHNHTCSHEGHLTGVMNVTRLLKNFDHIILQAFVYIKDIDMHHDGHQLSKQRGRKLKHQCLI